jgi:hypothetical protein
VFRCEVVGAVAASDTVAEWGDETLGRERRQGGWLFERDGLGLVEGIGADVEILARVGCIGGRAGVDGGCIFELLVLAGEVTGDANGGVDGTHGPAGETVEALPVLAEDTFAEFVDERRGHQRGALFFPAVDLLEQGLGEAGLRGEVAHHLRKQHSVGRHWAFRSDVGVAAAGGREECKESKRAGEAH